MTAATEHYAVGVNSVSQLFLEVGADVDGLDGKTQTFVGLCVAVIVLILISVLLCWCCCCCKFETDSSVNDINRQVINERTPLTRPQPPQGTSSQNCAEDRVVIKKLDKSRTVIAFQKNSPEACQRLQKHRAFLSDRVDVDFGLLDKLLGSTILSYAALQKIKSRNPFQERNEALLDYVVENNCYQGLRSALKAMHQSHIVNFLDADGVRRRACDGVWPLPEDIVLAMDSNRHSLLDLIDSTELVHELFASNVISVRHREAIASKTTSYERNETLLDIIRRISIKDYRKAMKCFHATKQSHIVQALVQGGKIVRVHANLQGVEEVSRTEQELVDKITYQLRNETTAYVDYILHLVQLRLIGVTVGHSVVCHFHCPSVDDLNSLGVKLRSGELEKSLDTVFRAALPGRRIAGVAITSVDDQHDDRAVFRDWIVGSLKNSRPASMNAADEIDDRELYSILEKNLPAHNREWKSKRPSKKY